MQQKLQGSLSASFKASPPVFGLHAAVQEWKHMVSVRGGQAGLLDKPPHREAMVNTDTVTATTPAAQEGDEMILTYNWYSGVIIAKLLETMSLYKMHHVHSNYRVISEPLVAH